MTTIEEHKLECLARWVLDRFETRAGRAAWLRDEYERRHGQAATDALKARILKIHQARRAS